jgi:hypothetical protein
MKEEYPVKSLIGLIVVASVIAATGAAPAAAQSLGNDPTKFNQMYDTALAKKDLAFLNAIVADDLKMTLNDQVTVWNRSQWMDLAKNGAYLSREVVTDQVERIGDNVVLATARISVKQKDPKRTGIDQWQHRMYQKRPAGWQLTMIRTLRETPTPAPGVPSLGSDYKTFNKQIDDAMVRADVDFLNGVIADDLTFILNDQKTVWTKKQWVDYIKIAKYAGRENIEEQNEQHGDVAVATTRVRTSYHDPAKRRLDQIHLRVYHRQPSGWKLVSMRALKEEAIPESAGAPGTAR